MTQQRPCGPDSEYGARGDAERDGPQRAHSHKLPLADRALPHGEVCLLPEANSPVLVSAGTGSFLAGEVYAGDGGGNRLSQCLKTRNVRVVIHAHNGASERLTHAEKEFRSSENG